MNLTDVDDKTIKGAVDNKISLQEFVKPYKEAFFEDLKMLNILPVEDYPAATDYIAEMVEMIQSLLDKGYAYQGKDGSVYFRIGSFPSYGRLSHLCLEELEAGASNRVELDEYEKDHIADFVLWKTYDAARDGDVFWESPFGRGRPGWHIECSAMARKLLGDTLDIHVGGVDNIFPHHENEIAQSECCTGRLFVRHWLHAQHLLVDGKKMSKRLGNFYTLRDLLDKGCRAEDIRYLLLQTHYRTQLNFTFQGIDAARHSLRRLGDMVLRLKEISRSSIEDVMTFHEARQHLGVAKNNFKEALGDDLGISQALAVIFDLVRELNSLCDQNQVSAKEAHEALALFKLFDQVLGCIPFHQEEEFPREVLDLLHQRELARKDKQWKLADIHRDAILAHGYVVEDTKAGPKLKKS
jgi:cysteinyl-tRNA synthetase